MKEPIVFKAHDNFVNDLFFTSDGQTLGSAGMDNVVNLWTVPNWELIRTIGGVQK